MFLPTDVIDGRASPDTMDTWAQAEFMNWDHVRTMVSSGRISLGSHTASHCSLPALSPTERMEQLVHSKARIEAETGHMVTGLAYPYGLARDYRSTESDVAKAGYAWAVTGVHGVNRVGGNPYALRRTAMTACAFLPGWCRAPWMDGSSSIWRGADRAGTGQQTAPMTFL